MPTKLFFFAYAVAAYLTFLATFLFAFQILCDFAGYSEIAIGTARILGFNLMMNFRCPYLAQSIPEFWRRWHISLSTWFRDYLFIPLGGSRVPTRRKYFNLFTTFFISGIWHGAAWTYVIWGALHGVFQVATLVGQSWRARIWSGRKKVQQSFGRRQVNRLTTFAAVCLAWVFFLADNLSVAAFALRRLASAPVEAWNIVATLLGGGSPWTGRYHILTSAVSLQDLIFMFTLIGVLIGVDALQEQGVGLSRLQAAPWYIRWPLYYALVMVIVLFGMFGKSEFIYFQF